MGQTTFAIQALKENHCLVGSPDKMKTKEDTNAPEVKSYTQNSVQKMLVVYMYSTNFFKPS